MDKENNSVINKANNTVSDTQHHNIDNFIKELKNKEKYYFDIPEEYRLNPAIVFIERKLGIRKSIKKGYNAIKNTFFVEELVLHKEWNKEIVGKEINTFFTDFSTYYEFLQGDIYKNACYYKYNFLQDNIIKFSIDISKINFKSFIDSNIDNFTLEISEIDMYQFSKAEKNKVALKKWLTNLNNCQTYDEFEKLLKSNKYNLSIDFLISNFIYSNNENKFKIITQYLNENKFFNFQKVLCLIFKPYEVLNACNIKFYSQATAKKWKGRLKSFIESLENYKIDFNTSSYFDTDLHYFVWYKIGKLKSCKNINEYIYSVDTCRYFETFEELAKFLNNNLSNCDLSQAILPDLNLSEYQVNEQTKLPLQYQKNLKYEIQKKYDRFTNCFTVEQTWTNEYGIPIKNYSHNFTYFFDFVYFLKNDLTDADLLFCDGLKNILDFSDINLNNAVIKSNIQEKLGVSYEKINITVDGFYETKSNELETVNNLTTEREELAYEETLNCQKIYYVTDLHLLHRLHNANCKSINDVLYILQKIIDTILNSVHNFENNVMLIGGDTCSDFIYFEVFIKLLRKSIDKRTLKIKVIFTLGNHELWDFDGKKFKDYVDTKFDEASLIEFEEIIQTYKKVITNNKMYLLQNNLIFKYDWNNIEVIDTEDLKRLSKEGLLIRLSKARLILFGGLGFSGYNEEFNANQLIYRFAISRQQEIEESKKFETLYKKICNNLSDRKIIVFTHMPQKDWCSEKTQIKGFIYVNGHTHRNYFYDDGDYRLYSDNQIGYYQKNCHLKYFYLEDDYDLFATYENGIYAITREEYIDFYLGKNINMNFDRNFAKLLMIKKNGYYMFILQSANGNLNILNGGSIKRLANNKISYYYENMDKVILYIKTPLDNFSNYQKQIADEIKAIGGIANIHGAIIDIDFSNHLYVNPFDSKVTAYWASDIINKVIFDDLPALLQSNRPDIYANYLKQIEKKSESVLVLNKSSILKSPQLYLDTDIYRASREIKKMQKLNSNILSIWFEPENFKLNDRNN